MSQYAQEHCVSDEDLDAGVRLYQVAPIEPTLATSAERFSPFTSDGSLSSYPQAVGTTLLGQQGPYAQQLGSDCSPAQSSFVAPYDGQHQLTVRWQAHSSLGADGLEATFTARFVLIDPSEILSSNGIDLSKELKQHVEGIASSSRTLGSAVEGKPSLRAQHTTGQRQVWWHNSVKQAAATLGAALSLWTRQYGLPNVTIEIEQAEDSGNDTWVQPAQVMGSQSVSGFAYNLSITNRFWREERDRDSTYYISSRGQVMKRPSTSPINTIGSGVPADAGFGQHALTDYEYEYWMSSTDGTPTYVVMYQPEGRLLDGKARRSLVSGKNAHLAWKGDLDDWPGVAKAQERNAAQLSMVHQLLASDDTLQSNIAYP